MLMIVDDWRCIHHMLMHMDAQEDLLASEIDADIDAESFMEDVENVMTPCFVKWTSNIARKLMQTMFRILCACSWLTYHHLYIFEDFEVTRRKRLRKDSLGGVKVWRCGEGRIASAALDIAPHLKMI